MSRVLSSSSLLAGSVKTFFLKKPHPRADRGLKQILSALKELHVWLRRFSTQNAECVRCPRMSPE